MTCSVHSLSFGLYSTVSKGRQKEEGHVKKTQQPDESFDEERAEEYVKEHKRHAAFMYGPFLKDMRKLKVSGRCLEIGAGAGIFTSLFAGQHPDLHLTVTDISPKMIALARETIRESLGEEEAKKRTDFFVCDVNDESALRKLGQFDLVYSVYSMHHWQNPESAILHLFKAINENGIFWGVGACYDVLVQSEVVSPILYSGIRSLYLTISNFAMILLAWKYAEAKPPR